MDIQVKIALQKQNSKISYHFSFVDGNADRGSTSARTLGNFFFKFWTSIFEMIAFQSFFSFVGRYWRRNCLSKENSRNLWPFFLGRQKCGRGYSIHADMVLHPHGHWEIFSWMFEPPYLEEEWSSFEAFFFMGRYWRQDFFSKRKIGNFFTNFPWHTKMRTGV